LDGVTQNEREVRAVRNQALFRAVNEKLLETTRAVEQPETFVISCECADVSCVETLEIPPGTYRDVRREPRRFAVLRGHVYPDVEDVVAEADGYVIVEKTGTGADVTRILAPPDGSSDTPGG
jgi:5-bromo-4-chloroindolyl phosphate hydrolysis protein